MAQITFRTDLPKYEEMSSEEMRQIKQEIEQHQNGSVRFVAQSGTFNIPTAFIEWWAEHKQQIVDLLVDIRQNNSRIMSQERLDQCDKILVNLRKVEPDLFPPEDEPIIVHDKSGNISERVVVSPGVFVLPNKPTEIYGLTNFPNRKTEDK